MPSSEDTDTLTSRQRELLEFIQTSVAQEGRIPSYREMAKALNVVAVGTIQDHVEVLVRRGYLEKTHSGKGGKKVQLKLAGHRQTPSMTIPIVGEVAAGQMRDAFEVALGSIPVSLPLMRKRSASAEKLFALRVSGESMIDAGILPGDLVVVDRSVTVKSGDFVVAERAGEATVKEVRFPIKSESGIQLIPHNKALKTIVIPPTEESFRIIGKVVSVQRFL